MLIFNGIYHGYLNLCAVHMGFNGILMGFNGDLMGFNGDLMGFTIWLYLT